MRLTYPSALILQALVGGHRYGFDIMDVTGLPSGTVYPALRRMEEAGLIHSRWETVSRREQRPPRKYYESTGEAGKALREVVGRYRLLEHVFPHLSRAPKPAKG